MDAKEHPCQQLSAYFAPRCKTDTINHLHNFLLVKPMDCPPILPFGKVIMASWVLASIVPEDANKPS